MMDIKFCNEFIANLELFFIVKNGVFIRNYFLILPFVIHYC